MAGKPVHVAFGGGRPTSDAGILLLVAAEQLADGILLARYALRHDAGHVQDNCASLRSFLIIASCVWASPTEKTRRTRKPGTKRPRTEPGCAVALDTLGAQPLCFAHYESPDARGCPWRKDIPAVLAAAPHI